MRGQCPFRHSELLMPTKCVINEGTMSYWCQQNVWSMRGQWVTDANKTCDQWGDSELLMSTKCVINEGTMSTDANKTCDQWGDSVHLDIVSYWCQQNVWSMREQWVTNANKMCDQWGCSCPVLTDDLALSTAPEIMMKLKKSELEKTIDRIKYLQKGGRGVPN